MTESKIAKIISKCDFFGKKVDLNYQSENTYKTCCGGFFSFGFIVLIVIIFYQQIQQFLLKEQIEVVSQEQYQTDPSLITIDPNEMIFMLQMSQDDFIKRPYFNITLEDRHYIRQTNGTLEKIKNIVDLQACTIEHFMQLRSKDTIDWELQFGIQKFGEYLCPPLNYEFNMQGTFTSEVFQFQKIQLQLCQNQTEIIDDTKEYSSACAPQEEIDEYAASDYSTFKLYFPNKLVNADEPENPTVDFLFNEVFFEIQAGRMYRSANIFFKEITLDTDESIWPWQDHQQKKVTLFTPGDFREMVSIGNDVPGEFYLRRSPYSKSYQRQFQKFDDIIAYLGGFIQAFIIGAGIFVGYYNDLNYTLNLANKLYAFQDQNQQKKSQNNEQKKILKKIQEVNEQQPIINTSKALFQRNGSRQFSIHAQDISNIIAKRQSLLHNIEKNQYKENNQIHEKTQTEKYIIKQNRDQNNTDIASFSNIEEFKGKEVQENLKKMKTLYQDLGFRNRNEFLKNQFQDIVESQKQLKFTIKYILNIIFCGILFNNEEVKLISKAKNKITQDLDIYQIIDNVKELKKLKNVLFDKDQERLFNFFPKPLISTNSSGEIYSEDDINDMIKFRTINESQSMAQSSYRQSVKSNRGQKSKSKYNQDFKQLSFKEIVIAQKFAMRIKKKVKALRQQKLQDQATFELNNYQQLYSSYKILIDGQNQNEILKQQNKRLFNLLGKEMLTIFETSKMIKDVDDEGNKKLKIENKITQENSKQKQNQQYTFNQLSQTKINQEQDQKNNQNDKKNILIQPQQKQNKNTQGSPGQDFITDQSSCGLFKLDMTNKTIDNQLINIQDNDDICLDNIPLENDESQLKEQKHQLSQVNKSQNYDFIL